MMNTTKNHQVEIQSKLYNVLTTHTLYPNQFMSQLVDDPSGNNDMFTKNYYAGNQMVASSLVYSGNPVATYYYHTDHLGSNTYLTDSTGKLMEHVEYMPWGDSWWEQSLITNYAI